jgi:hypothetical protein
VKRTGFARALAVTALLAAAGPAAAGDVNAVIELFTSQGCSSCPPADRLLGEYADRKDVLALSFNVDYWDYLGWKDTLASPDNTERQRDYARARGDGQVYTPQVVVDGRTHVVGSSRPAIEAAIQKVGPLRVPIALSAAGDSITATIGKAAADAPHATLWLVMYDRSVTVPIGRGENEGHTVTYNDVVRKLRPVEMWKGEAMSVDLPRSEMSQVNADRCAVFLQAETASGLPGPILGAATLDMSK